MNILWGGLITAVGIFMLVSGITKSHFIVYRLMVARSRVLWGEKVHVFYQIAGILIIIFGALFAFGRIQDSLVTLTNHFGCDPYLDSAA